MPSVFYQFVLMLTVFLGVTTLMQPHQDTQAYMQTLHALQRAGIEYIGAHCQALPPTITQATLQATGNLPDGFDNQGTAFIWRVADHPVVSVNVSGNADYLAFLSTHTLGGFEVDGSYTFIPDYDASLLHAAGSSHNLLVYDNKNPACKPL